MKVLLLQPPVEDFYETDIRLQPIGLCYLKAALRRHLPDIEVVIKDFRHGWRRQTLPVPRELNYLKDYYALHDQSPFSTFHQYFHFGADFEQIGLDVARESPDVVGISCLFSPYYRETLRCAQEIKKRISVPIVAGGSHVSAAPLQILRDPSIDFIIRGEGERPFVEFLKTWQNGQAFEKVPNLGFKKEGQLFLNPLEDNFPLNDLPHPDLSDLEPHRYLFEKKPMTFVITSRSCPHRCSFCSVHQTFGYNFRRRLTQNVLEEIKSRYQAGYRVFDFEDDNLTFYQNEMKELCRELIRAFPEKDVKFVAMNGISYLSLDRELLQLMRQAGFSHLNIALVSSDITVRETTKRPHTIPKYLDVIHEAFQLGFEIVSYQILGLPNESLDSMIQTLVFNARLPVLLGASMFYLTPYSPIAKNFLETTDEDIFKSRLTAMAIETENFKREDLYTLFITTRIINFLKGLDFSATCSLQADRLADAQNSPVRQRTDSSALRRTRNSSLAPSALLDRQDCLEATHGAVRRLVPPKEDPNSECAGGRLPQEQTNRRCRKTNVPATVNKRIDLETILEVAKSLDKRSALGAKILDRLFEEKILYGATRNGFYPLKKFKPELFFKVWNQLDWIGTQKGQRINLEQRTPRSSSLLIG